jgi:hypothetical protein
MVIAPIETAPIEDGVEVEGGIAALIWIVAVDGMFLFLSDLSSTYHYLSLPSARFISQAITHLFNTTYDPTDDLTVSALLTYLNSAMPADKWEEFDTCEVVKTLGGMKDKALEGDVIRRVV